MKKTTVRLALLGALAYAGSAGAGTILSQGFDDVSSLAGAGWVLTNNSQPAPTPGPGVSTNWFQGNSGVFASQGGSADSYIGANFTVAGGGGDISLWLLTPTLLLNNGDTVSFYTRTDLDGAPYGDSLQVLLSANGSSTNVGSSATSLGDFTNLLGSVAPGAYPESWTQFTFTVSGLSGATSGRLGFRYVVSDTSTNGDYIGIDSLLVSDATPVPLPASAWLLLSGVAGLVMLRRRQFALQA